MDFGYWYSNLVGIWIVSDDVYNWATDREAFPKESMTSIIIRTVSAVPAFSTVSPVKQVLGNAVASRFSPLPLI